jgi:hypothetical protein
VEGIGRAANGRGSSDDEHWRHSDSSGADVAGTRSRLV